MRCSGRASELSCSACWAVPRGCAVDSGPRTAPMRGSSGLSSAWCGSWWRAGFWPAVLRRRINATKWPEREIVNDQSQGVQLSTMQNLARYWGTQYDWRKCEARLAALPQFTTTIDGVDIHFIHLRSKEKNALPVIVTHGWPGSIIEQLKIIDPLTNPTAHGGTAADAFDVVIPSLPGYGFSGQP